MGKRRVGFIHSIMFKVCLAIVFAIVFTGIMMIATYSPNLKTEISSMAKSYLEDLAVSYGSLLDIGIKEDNADSVLDSENLSDILEGVGIDGVESSYVYVTSSDGTMLYHPTSEKIGKPVENDAVKSVVADISAGKKIKNDIVTYKYNGVSKYAGIYVNDGNDFIVIVTADEDELFESVQKINKNGIIGLIMCIVICGIIGGVIAFIIVRPINSIVNFTGKVADMDLTSDDNKNIIAKRKDETGLMGRAITDLKEQLINVVSSIKEQSELLKDAAAVLNTNTGETNSAMEQVERAVEDIAQGASSQAEETQKATENVILMGDMVSETENEVEKVMASSRKMEKASGYAKEIFTDLESINKKAEEYIDLIAKQTDMTNESAVQISNAVEMITSIAEETNLLSLNASIEAARAGEQGRGFAVVAGQIQKLAEQSNESAKEIENIIIKLQSDSKSAVKIMEDVKEIIREQSEFVAKTDTAFSDIEDGVKQSAEGMDMIHNRTQRLNDARVNVVDLVQNLTAIAEENAASSQETSASVEEVTGIIANMAEQAEKLEEIAQGLEEKVSVFKV